MIKDKFLGRWVSLYFYRGYQRANIPFAMAANGVTVVGILYLIFGLKQTDLFYLSVIGLAALVGFVSLVFGFWDYSKKGSRIYETVKGLESDAGTIFITSESMTLQLRIAEKLGIEVTPGFKQAEETLRRWREKYDSSVFA
jgi:hypothetical protein